MLPAFLQKTTLTYNSQNWNKGKLSLNHAHSPTQESKKFKTSRRYHRSEVGHKNQSDLKLGLQTSPVAAKRFFKNTLRRGVHDE